MKSGLELGAIVFALTWIENACAETKMETVRKCAHIFSKALKHLQSPGGAPLSALWTNKKNHKSTTTEILGPEALGRSVIAQSYLQP